MATSDCWEVTMKGSIFNQAADNVFFFRGMTGIDPDEVDIATAFYEQFWPLVKAAVSLDYNLESINVRHLFTGVTEYVLPVGEHGDAGSNDTQSAFNAFGFKMNVAGTTTRPGSKRFAGVDQTLITDGVVVDGTEIGLLQDLADGLAEPLRDTALGIVTWAVPVIVKRILDGDSYRLPESVGELVANLVLSGVASLLVTSQNSRKSGRGI